MLKLFSKTLFFALIIYSFLGFFLLPYVVHFTTPTYLKKNYNIDVYMDSIHVNPFTFSVTVNNFILKDPSLNNLVYFEKLFVEADPMKAFQNKLHINEILLDNAQINVSVDIQKTPNYQFLLDTFSQKSDTPINSESTDKKEPMSLFIKHFDVTFLTFLFQDSSKKELFTLESKPINFTLEDISLDRDHKNKIAIDIQTKRSGEISLLSSFTADPLSLEGELSLKNIVVEKFFTYFKPNDLALLLQGKHLDSSLEYSFKILEDKSVVDLKNISLNLPKAMVQKDDFVFDLNGYLLDIDTINFEQNDKTSHFFLEGIESTLEKLKVQDGLYSTSFVLNDINASVKKVTSDTKEPISFVQSLQTLSKGSLVTKGEFTQEPLSVAMDMSLKDIDLVPYKKYLEPFVNIGLDSAYVSTQSHFEYFQDGDKNKIELLSDVSLAKIDIQNSAMKQPFLKIKKFDISKLSYKNNSLNIAKLLVKEPNFQFYLNDNNTTNLTNLLNQNEKENKSEKKGEPLQYTIEEVVVEDGSSQYFDNSLENPVRLKESGVNIYIKNISSKKDAITQIEHKSTIEKYATIESKGTLIVSEPLKNLSAKSQLRNFNLENISSYGEKYIGNKIDQGKLFLTLDHQIENKKLTAKNHIQIKDIELGEKVESKDAIDAPIGLAIALLEDSQGYIDLDIPINGDLANPQFEIGDAIFDVIRNTIVGIVSAPFKFLGLIVGLGQSDELSSIHFEYGQSKVDALGKENLDKLGTIFAKRPGIELKIKPSYLEKEDSKALKEKNFKKEYSELLDETLALEKRLQLTSGVFITLYSKEELDSIKLENEQKLQYLLNMIENGITIEKSELIALANARAKAIKEYLVSKGVNEKRIIILEEIDTTKKESRLEQVVVNFELGI